MTPFRAFFLGLAAFASQSVQAIPVEYRFTGNITGDIFSLTVRQSLANTPFQLSIFADTDSAAYLGRIAGAGSAYANNSSHAVWRIDGLGDAVSADVQVYAIPGIGRIGFGWNGKVFPLGTDNPAQTHLYFNGNEIATDTRYGRLSSTVGPIAVGLQTPLENPPSMLPQYSTFLFLGDMGTLTLKGLSNVSYAVVAVPEPSSLALFLTGAGAVGVAVGRRRAGTTCACEPHPPCALR